MQDVQRHGFPVLKVEWGSVDVAFEEKHFIQGIPFSTELNVGIGEGIIS